jgi:hypothetical protein
LTLILPDRTMAPKRMERQFDNAGALRRPEQLSSPTGVSIRSSSIQKPAEHDSDPAARADHSTCARRARFCRNADAVSGKQRGRPLETAAHNEDTETTSGRAAVATYRSTSQQRWQQIKRLGFPSRRSYLGHIHRAALAPFGSPLGRARWPGAP